MKGFPVTEERCEHGAGLGAICEYCAGPVNFALQLLLSVDAQVKPRPGEVRPFTGENVPASVALEAVRIRDDLRRWATDREICFAGAGACACFSCAEACHFCGRIVEEEETRRIRFVHGGEHLVSCPDCARLKLDGDGRYRKLR